MNARFVVAFAALGVLTSAHGLVLTGVARSIDGSGFNHNLLLGTIQGQAGYRIKIDRIGIGGDADAASGKQAFRAIGGGLNFVFAAGQNQNPPFAMDYVLAPTSQTSGAHGRSLSLMWLNDVLAQPGESVELRWLGTADWDGHYTVDTDPMGTNIDDSRLLASARAWVQYSYVPVPEPCGIGAVIVGLSVIGRRRLIRRRR
jgi:hypothetical protein